MTSFPSELIKQYDRLDPHRAAVVRNWVAKAKYLELALALNDPEVRPGLDQAISDYRRSRESFTPQLAALIILLLLLIVAIYKSIAP